VGERHVNIYGSLENAPDTFMVDLENFTMPVDGYMTSNFGEGVAAVIIMVSTLRRRRAILSTRRSMAKSGSSSTKGGDTGTTW